MKVFLGSALMLCLLGTFLSCNGKNMVAANAMAPTTAAVFEPDVRFASIDTLAEFMADEISAKTIDEFVNRYEQQAVAIKSYGCLNHGERMKTSGIKPCAVTCGRWPTDCLAAARLTW